MNQILLGDLSDENIVSYIRQMHKVFGVIYGGITILVLAL